MNTSVSDVFYSAKNYPMANNKGVQFALLYVIENRFSIFRYGQVPLLSMISYPSDARSKLCRLLRMG